ncbi:amino acid carrier protein [Rivularia sp. PCC 7116]|uniref:alanine/glycine:cation symporter family protein n=1 Tax=Rivularia sp. PCC 7116 TaxID=373994 RepID=UPI00029EF9A0|nr:alanine/glycine:cation symporter family protein [Rivularia sp. PCC 7116]AFY54045.1 amino acid carrier protein [Rivularia sp. PCC 7116]
MWKSLYKRPWLLTLLLCLIPTAVFAADEAAGEPLIQQLDAAFSGFVKGIFDVLFFSIGGFPLIVLWLIFGAIFFTIRMGFVNFRMFGHAVDIVRGKYDDPNAPGEVSHFQALATALSATVGLGNIAGVAIAISVGGPGATLWMTLGGLLGMSSKFVESTLGQKYRIIKPDGKVAGGPMYYLSRGFAEIGLPAFGNVLAIVFSVCCIFAAFGAANMIQVNQSYGAVKEIFPIYPWVYGLILAILVGLVMIGGIHRIGQVAGTIVPVMCVLYVVAALWILLINFTAIPGAIATIFQQAFSPEAVEGGIIGVIVQGFRRSTFSNEAGVGSAAIAHSAARTDRPIKEGLVALLEPFIDTVVICNMTALVIVITGVWNNPEYEAIRKAGEGAALTSKAFGTQISWFPVLLSISVFLFAFSTMISWSYYAERAWEYLFSERSLIVYRILFVIAVFIGAIAKPQSVIDFGDATFFAMALFNMLGMYFLTNKVLEDLNDYRHYLQQPKL